jgi:hypothetical protein
MAITPTESVAFSNISTTTSPFTLKGGTYSFIMRATSYGTTVQLQTLAPDGSTWVNAAANVTADGTNTYSNLPPGQYRINISGATGLFADLTRVPA